MPPPVRWAPSPGPGSVPQVGDVEAAPLRRLRSVLVSVALAVVVAGLLAAGFEAAWGLLVGAAVMVPLERLFRRHDQPVLRAGIRADVAHFLFTHLLQLVCLLAAVGVTYLVLSPLTIPVARDWIAAQSAPTRFLLAMVLLETAYYAEHRLAHRWGFLWRFHAIHHSSERLDWLAAARLHPAEAFVGGFVLAPVFVILGFAPVSIGIVSAVQTTWAVVIHANVRWRLRPLDRIWPTPEYHHWHHSNEPEALNKNFGLPLLDTIFGTYYMPADRRPAVYGIDREVPQTYLGQLADPFRRRARRASGPATATGAGRPEAHRSEGAPSAHRHAPASDGTMANA